MSRKRAHSHREARADSVPAPVAAGAAAVDAATPDSTPPGPEVAIPATAPPADAAAVDPYALLADYERRSLAHDPGLPEEIETPGLWRALGFRVGARAFATGIDEVSEILISPPPVTSVPGTRPWLLGVANVRGTLVAMVDLKQFLFGQQTHITRRARVLVVRQAGGNVGLLVDELLGQRNFGEADRRTDTAADGDPRLAQFVTGDVLLGTERLGRLDMSALTHAAEFQHAAL